MKVIRQRILERIITILILIGGLSLGLKASAEESSLISSELICLAEIKKSDFMIDLSRTDDGIVDQAAQSAIKRCLLGFGQDQKSAYQSFADLCDKSFADIQGTTPEAMASYCKLNAVRFVLSLQLQRQK